MLFKYNSELYIGELSPNLDDDIQKYISEYPNCITNSINDKNYAIISIKDKLIMAITLRPINRVINVNLKRI